MHVIFFSINLASVTFSKLVLVEKKKGEQPVVNLGEVGLLFCSLLHHLSQPATM